MLVQNFKKSIGRKQTLPICITFPENAVVNKIS